MLKCRAFPFLTFMTQLLTSCWIAVFSLSVVWSDHLHSFSFCLPSHKNPHKQLSKDGSGVPLSEASHYLWSDFSVQLPGLRVYFYPPYVPPHPLAASGGGVSLASSLTKDKWALGLWWSSMAARGFQNSKLFFIWSKVIWSTMQQALTFTISYYVGMYFILFPYFCFKLSSYTGGGGGGGGVEHVAIKIPIHHCWTVLLSIFRKSSFQHSCDHFFLCI